MGGGLNRGGPFRRLSIRNKLLALVLMPLAVVLPLLGLLLLVWSGEALDRLLIAKVRADLAVAQGYFERVRDEVGGHIEAAAGSQALHAALAGSGSGSGSGAGAGAGAELETLLQRIKSARQLDFIHLRAPDGSLRASAGGHPPAAGLPTLPGAGSDGATASVEVLAAAQLAVLDATLRARVPVPLLATRNATPTTRTREERAMVLMATHAVRGADGRLLGQLQGGVLLNRNLPFIDHINEIVYPAGSLPFGSRGTATLFLDDVRISTNVRLFDSAAGERENRAIGTRVSATVRDAVLVRGGTWLDRAFVVDEWYVSGYQPLHNSAGAPVGMLYVGYLERPFTLLKYGALLSIGVVFFAVMIGAALVSLRWARTIFRPLEQMEATMRSVEDGALDARVGAVDSADEVGRLAGHLDRLLGVIDGNTQALRRWNAELDAMVAERTQALADAQSQLVRSEKLATVGQLTASIAHEVNNPIAVIQGNLDLLRELLEPAQAARVGAELRLIDGQIERMRLIVTQLLQFARPGEYAGYVEQVDVGRALDDSMVLVSHQLATTGIAVQREVATLRTAAINRQELQQVLVNLLVNAIHAMPGGGSLRLRCADWGADGVAISVGDSGPGLAPEVLAQLFQPFVTRKKDGTGLGLWISRGIVERYGGDLTAANREDGAGGAVFTVWLRTDAATG